MSLTDDQIARYERQILLPEVGGRGQERLLESTVRVMGAGGAADELVTYLAAGGVGSIVLDETFPLERRRFIQGLNPDVSIGSEGAADIVIDCGDSDDRFWGSQNALKIMLQRLNAGDSQAWTRETGTWWAT